MNADEERLLKNLKRCFPKYEEKALLLDPDSVPAKTFYNSILTGSQQRNGWWGRGR